MLDYSKIFSSLTQVSGENGGLDVCSLPCAAPNAAQSEALRLEMLLAPTLSALNLTRGIGATSRVYVANVERKAEGGLGCAPDALVVTLDVACSGIRLCGAVTETDWTQSYELSFVNAQRSLLQNRRSRQIVWESSDVFESLGRRVETCLFAQEGAEALFRLVASLRPHAVEELRGNLDRITQRQLVSAGLSLC